MPSAGLPLKVSTRIESLAVRPSKQADGPVRATSNAIGHGMKRQPRLPRHSLVALR